MALWEQLFLCVIIGVNTLILINNIPRYTRRRITTFASFGRLVLVAVPILNFIALAVCPGGIPRQYISSAIIEYCLFAIG